MGWEQDKGDEVGGMLVGLGAKVIFKISAGSLKVGDATRTGVGSEGS